MFNQPHRDEVINFFIAKTKKFILHPKIDI